MSHQYHQNGTERSSNVLDFKHITEVLGPKPRDTISALADYGLNNHEIARYYGISVSTIEAIRQYSSTTEKFGISSTELNKDVE